MNQYGVYFVILLIVIPLLFFVPSVFNDHNNKTVVDNSRSITYGCSEPESISHSTIQVNSYNYSDGSINTNITYEFNFTNSIDEYEVVKINRPSIQSVERNATDNSITVNVHQSYRIGYESHFENENTVVYSPDVTISKVVETEGQSQGRIGQILGNVRISEIYTYDDYYNCFSEVKYEDPVTGYVSSDEIILEFGSDESTVYNIGVNNSERNYTVSGGFSDEQLSHIVSSAEISGSYNKTFTESERIQIYSNSNMSAPGFIIGLSSETPLVFAQPKFATSQSSVVGHELSHSFQNYRTSENAKWLIEGSAQYMGAIINNEADRMYTSPGVHAFWPGWNERAESRNQSEYNDIKMVDPDSWYFDSNYRRGSRIIYLLDRSIRYHNGNKTIFDFTERLNKEGYVSHSDAVRIVEDMTSKEFADRYDRMSHQSKPVDIESELESMELDNNEVHFPETFNRNDSYVVECNYDSNVAIVEKCEG